MIDPSLARVLRNSVWGSCGVACDHDFVLTNGVYPLGAYGCFFLGWLVMFHLISTRLLELVMVAYFFLSSIPCETIIGFHALTTYKIDQDHEGYNQTALLRLDWHRKS